MSSSYAFIFLKPFARFRDSILKHPKEDGMGGTEKQLVRSARAGDKDAFSQLWHIYQFSAQQWAFRRVQDFDEAEDLHERGFWRGAWSPQAGTLFLPRRNWFPL